MAEDGQLGRDSEEMPFVRAHDRAGAAVKLILISRVESIPSNFDSAQAVLGEVRRCILMMSSLKLMDLLHRLPMGSVEPDPEQDTDQEKVLDLDEERIQDPDQEKVLDPGVAEADTTFSTIR